MWIYNPTTTESDQFIDEEETHIIVDSSDDSCDHQGDSSYGSWEQFIDRDLYGKGDVKNIM
jgi:hypothetical protein